MTCDIDGKQDKLINSVLCTKVCIRKQKYPKYCLNCEVKNNIHSYLIWVKWVYLVSKENENKLSVLTCDTKSKFSFLKIKAPLYR